MENIYETVTVTVLQDRVPELLEYAGSLARPAKEEEEAADPDEAASGPPAAKGFSQASVISAYRGGVSEYWPVFLRILAQQSLAAAGTSNDGWVAWDKLCAAIGLAPRSAAGMLGAAERRCQGAPPYEKAYEGGHWFRMPEAVARLIIELAEDQSAA